VWDTQFNKPDPGMADASAIPARRYADDGLQPVRHDNPRLGASYEVISAAIREHWNCDGGFPALPFPI